MPFEGTSRLGPSRLPTGKGTLPSGDLNMHWLSALLDDCLPQQPGDKGFEARYQEYWYCYFERQALAVQAAGGGDVADDAVVAAQITMRVVVSYGCTWLASSKVQGTWVFVALFC